VPAIALKLASAERAMAALKIERFELFDFVIFGWLVLIGQCPAAAHLK